MNEWNWQQAGWPQFIYDPTPLLAREGQFLQRCGLVAGTVTHLDDESAVSLRVELLGDEALKTSEIEGEMLDRESLQSSIRGHLGLGPEASRRPSGAEEGIAELMVEVYGTSSERLDEPTLFAWHRMVMRDSRIDQVGAYRREAMQIVSGRIDEPTVHFEAPPADAVQGEMEEFIRWFNRTAPEGEQPLPAMTRAGLSHLYFESIHPFEDGNGRIGRALCEKALAQSVGHPTLIALSQTIHGRRREYYDALGAASRSLKVDDWLEFFVDVVLEAQQESLGRVTFLVEKAKFFDRFGSALNGRQEKALVRVFREGPDGFKGGLSAGNYLSITKTSRATATRDLAELVEMGALTKEGVGKGTRYFLAR